jgi:hypothetical protein
LRHGVCVTVAFVVLFATLTDFVSLSAQQRRIEGLAPVVAPYLDRDGFTLVVLVQTGRDAIPPGTPSYELTARIAARLPADLQQRLWVVPYASRNNEGVTGLELVGTAEGEPVLERALRGMEGRIEPTRVVWVEIDRDPPRITSGDPAPRPDARGG